jgi:hypothetical protein
MPADVTYTGGSQFQIVHAYPLRIECRTQSYPTQKGNDHVATQKLFLCLSFFL